MCLGCRSAGEVAAGTHGRCRCRTNTDKCATACRSYPLPLGLLVQRGCEHYGVSWSAACTPQSVDDIVAFVEEQLQQQQASQAQAQREEEEDDDEEDEDGTRQRPRGGAAAAAGAGTQQRSGPSALLKTLRPAPAPRPLFLAAPGVANAQVGEVWGMGEWFFSVQGHDARE